MANYTIRLDNPRINLLPRTRRLGFSHEPYEVTISFPLISEDPVAFERKASSLGEVSLPSSPLCCSLLSSYYALPSSPPAQCSFFLGLCLASTPSVPFYPSVDSLISTFIPHLAPPTQVMPGGMTSTATLISKNATTFNPALHHAKWTEFPIRHRVVASMRFSEHILIKVSILVGWGKGGGKKRGFP